MIANRFQLHRIVRRPSRMPLRAARKVSRVQPYELVLRGQNKTLLYACASCGRAYSHKDFIGSPEQTIAWARDKAERCCNGRCEDCGVTPVKRHFSRCDDCQEKRRIHRDRAWAARAKIVPLDKSAWIYCDDLSGHNEGYFQCFDELLEYLTDLETEDDVMPTLPSHVIPCKPVIVSINADSMCQQLSEDIGWEDDDDALDRLDGLDKLLAAIQAFNDANATNHFAWEPDYRRVVILDAEAFNAEFGTSRDGLPILRWEDRPPSIRPMWLARYNNIIRREIEEGKERQRKFEAELREKYPPVR